MTLNALFHYSRKKKKKNVSLLTATTAMLNHQAEFGVILAEIYDPALGVPSGEVTPRRVQTAPESVQAVDDFQAVMREMRDILLPEVVSESAVVAVSANKEKIRCTDSDFSQTYSNMCRQNHQ